MKKLPLNLVSLLFLSFSVVSQAAPRFSGGEHEFMGDAVHLQLSRTDAPTLFKMSNGATLTYGELLELGDFYGLVDKPISQGNTPEERVARFTSVFNLMDADVNAATEIPKLLEVLHKELNYVQDAMSKGISAKEAYSKVSGVTDREVNCITGGGCSTLAWWTKQGRATALASTNFDHFGDAAWLAYETGHRAALAEAQLGYRTQDEAHLQRAYAMNALASHFLADRFSSGHIRGPRLELSEHVTPTSIGNVLMKYMHDEENAGLDVHNLSGDRWRAYGDGYYFEVSSAEHRKHIADALQQSADEVFAAYHSGEVSENSSITNLIPIPDESEAVCRNDVAELFVWDKNRQIMLRRRDILNPHDCNWTSLWFGWSTLLELAKDDGIPISFQGQLAQSKYAARALQAGLITDRNVVNYLQKRK